jgi:hypothetical protein
MACGPTLATKEKKNYPETAESGQFMRSTMLDMDSRLRVARAIEKDETQASISVFQMLSAAGTRMLRPRPFQTAGVELTRP